MGSTSKVFFDTSKPLDEAFQGFMPDLPPSFIELLKDADNFIWNLSAQTRSPVMLRVAGLYVPYLSQTLHDVFTDRLEDTYAYTSRRLSMIVRELFLKRYLPVLYEGQGVDGELKSEEFLCRMNDVEWGDFCSKLRNNFWVRSQTVSNIIMVAGDRALKSLPPVMYETTTIAIERGIYESHAQQLILAADRAAVNCLRVWHRGLRQGLSNQAILAHIHTDLDPDFVDHPVLVQRRSRPPSSPNITS